jgi:plastocyanin
MGSWKVFVVVAGSALTLAACGGGGGGNGNTGAADAGCTVKGNTTTAVTPAVVSNIVTDPNTVGRFTPNDMTVKVGQAVEWDWQDPNVAHTVTSDDGTSFDSCLQNKGYKFVVTFNQAGKIPYHCTIHPLMIGTITVTP